ILDVVEPSVKALDTALRIEELASDLGVGSVKFVANKVSSIKDLEFIKGRLGRDRALLGWIPLDPMVFKTDMEGKALLDYAPDCPAIKSIGELASRLERIAFNSP
ncbi:MAG: hypothetical protein ACP5K1_07260, partial [Candidatus Bathyarchaeia archaeon]